MRSASDPWTRGLTDGQPQVAQEHDGAKKAVGELGSPASPTIVTAPGIVGAHDVAKAAKVGRPNLHRLLNLGDGEPARQYPSAEAEKTSCAQKPSDLRCAGPEGTWRSRGWTEDSLSTLSPLQSACIVIRTDPAAAAIEAVFSRRTEATYRLPHALIQPRNTVMTRERVLTGIGKGLGQGRDDYYQPWLRVRRRLASPISNLLVFSTPLYELRPLHLMSGLEACAARVALWLGACEIREQFPAWPDPHDHPNLGRHRDERLYEAPGLREIARLLGVSHGVYPGTDIPYVATIDLNIEHRTPDGRSNLVFWPVKPAQLCEAPRVKERLALQEAYAEAVGGHCYVFGWTPMPEHLDAQLGWFQPRQLTMQAFAGTQLLADFAGHFMEVAGECAANCAYDYAGHKLGVRDLEFRQLMFRVACWLGVIPADFSRLILLSRPLIVDQGFKNELRNRLFGVS